MMMGVAMDEMDTGIAEPGLISSRIDPVTGLPMVLYSSKEAGFTNSTGKYTLYCTEHGETCCETNLRRAKSMLRTPSFWCAECRDLSDTGEDRDLKIVPYDLKSTEQKEREMRAFARFAKGDFEKAALFEAVYGTKPDSFWD